MSRTASCPACGAGLEFRNAATVFVVCPFCGGAAARTGLDLESLGKVAALAPLDSVLELGMSGTSGKRSWTAVGLVQLDHGSGPWNEWCLSFSDGTWGWFAEAQGEFLLTFPVPRLPVPPHGKISVGDPVDLGKAGTFVVAERGRAKVTAARGEFPVPIRPGEPRLYADLRSETGFATLDYGDDDTCDAVYVGRTVTAEEMGIGAPAAAAGPREVSSHRLQCGRCGGQITLRDPGGAVRVVCTSCGHLLDAADPHGKVYGIGRATEAKPTIPLGARGTLRGFKVECLAMLERSVTVEGVRYAWKEYLLRTEARSYLWLVEAKGHWNLVRPLSPGEVNLKKKTAKWKGRRFAHFQSGKAVVDCVLGEVYWKVAVGDAVSTDDYVDPPHMISVEEDRKERNVSLGEYVGADEVREGFGVEPVMPRPRGVAPNQPNPHGASEKRWWILAGSFALVDIVLTAVFSARKAETPLFPCCLTFPILLLPAIVTSLRSASVEASRWSESDHAEEGTGRAGFVIVVFVVAAWLFAMCAGAMTAGD